jgi:hypothetical protein
VLGHGRSCLPVRVVLAQNHVLSAACAAATLAVAIEDIIRVQVPVHRALGSRAAYQLYSYAVRCIMLCSITTALCCDPAALQLGGDGGRAVLCS